jgi:hypothetical protein
VVADCLGQLGVRAAAQDDQVTDHGDGGVCRRKA